jgi:carbamoyltransferase
MGTGTILGLNGADGVGHDGGVALVIDGRLVAAVEEERLTRNKRSFGVPPLRSLVEVLRVGGISPRHIDTVAYPWSPSAMGMKFDEITARLRSWFARAGLPISAHTSFQCVDHHDAHAWAGTAFLPDQAAGRDVAVLVLDGTGESTSGAAYRMNSEMTKLWNLEQSSSLGIYYEAVTQFLGFSWGEEGKTMGLASYGRESDLRLPSLSDRRFTGNLPRFTNTAETPRSLHEQIRAGFMAELASWHGNPGSFNNRADLALAAQGVLADRIRTYADELLDGVGHLILSGGVALNCSANGQLADYCRERGVQLVVPAPASDTGVAIGAAIAVARQNARSPISVDDVGLGRQFSGDEIGAVLHDFGLRVTPCGPDAVARKLISESEICGWIQGGSEIGPRALGHRSILARPDSTRVRDRLNYLKGRESWRPLAPSLSMDEFERSFRGSVPSPYMLVAAQAVPGSEDRLGGVIHVDGSARPQVVQQGGPYRSLLAEIAKLTDAGAVTCTSFNSSGEPMVYSPQDALVSARKMSLDFLAGDGWICDLD